MVLNLTVRETGVSSHSISYADYVSSACPAHSTGTATCTCTDPYVPDSAGTACVLPNNCPANMSGTPCACISSDYVPDPNGPGCVYQTLTLTIESAYSAKGPYTTEPGSVLVLKAVVKNQFGLPKSDKQITLTVNVKGGSGGHDHDENRPKGEVCALLFGCTQGSSGTLVTTDSSGEASFVFRAPLPAGEHTITATCAGCNEANATVDVKVNGLIPIPASPLYALQDSAGNVIGAIRNQHSDNHYLTADAIDKLEELATIYTIIVNSGAKLYLNDASLVWGGLFDVDKTKPWKSPHIGHDRGRSIDIRAENSGPNNEGAVPAILFTKLSEKAAEKNIKVALHCARNQIGTICNGIPDNRHFHVDF